MAKAKSIRDLIVWQRAMELAEECYRLTALKAAKNSLRRGKRNAAIGQVTAFTHHVDALGGSPHLNRETVESLNRQAGLIIDAIRHLP